MIIFIFSFISSTFMNINIISIYAIDKSSYPIESIINRKTSSQTLELHGHLTIETGGT